MDVARATRASGRLSPPGPAELTISKSITRRLQLAVDKGVNDTVFWVAEDRDIANLVTYEVFILQ